MGFIKTNRLPIGVIHYSDFIFEYGGEFSIKEESIIDYTEQDGIITDCHLVEDDVELKWFSTEGILYIFIDGVNVCYFDQGKLHFI